MKKTFIIIFLILSLLPLVLIPIQSHTDETLPDISDDNGINIHYLNDMQNYFSTAFGMRNTLIDSTSHLKISLFHTSTQDDVIIGKDGYLFYGETIDDYQGSKTMSDDDLKKSAYNLKLMQNILKSSDINFIFTIAPNKNSLYGQYMPDLYQSHHDTSNASRLQTYLKNNKINYVNLFELFNKDKTVYYHKTDSHWNNMGAIKAMEAILERLHKDYTDYSKIAYKTTNTFQGDLYKMLYPESTDHEEDYEYEKKFTYEYIEDITSTYDRYIETYNENKDGNLYMYRDSFGNALLPYVAEEYGSAVFTRESIYTLNDAINNEADTVVIELVERHLKNLLDAPILNSEEDSVVTKVKTDTSYKGSIKVKEEDDYIQVTGTYDSRYLHDNTYLALRYKGDKEMSLYPCFHTKKGYSVCIDKNSLFEGQCDLLLVSKHNKQLISSKVLDEKEF